MKIRRIHSFLLFLNIPRIAQCLVTCKQAPLINFPSSKGRKIYNTPPYTAPKAFFQSKINFHQFNTINLAKKKKKIKHLLAPIGAKLCIVIAKFLRIIINVALILTLASTMNLQHSSYIAHASTSRCRSSSSSVSRRNTNRRKLSSSSENLLGVKVCLISAAGAILYLRNRGNGRDINDGGDAWLGNVISNVDDPFNKNIKSEIESIEEIDDGFGDAWLGTVSDLLQDSNDEKVAVEEEEDKDKDKDSYQ